MEHGRWNGIVEWWNGGILEWWNERLTTLYHFYSHKWANWACALAIIIIFDVEKHGMVWIPGYLLLENIDISTS